MLAAGKPPAAGMLGSAAMSDFRRFRGTTRYLTNDALEAAVNCALARLSEIDDIYPGAMITPGANS